ncbi:MAG TPA: amidase family protein, partial [Ilumatobacteraceae bacterium]
PSLPLAGEVLAVKACFDVEGWTTHAGSAVLADAAVATADAPMVEQLRSAGAILLAQTNMTEFAYGALGLNSTYGTPTTPLCPGDDRVAGGSTSGGAVAVALGAADIALGSDTSGSIRIPAAFVGAAGFKPSQGRYPTGGMIPLSTSFDAPGIITTTVADVTRVDAAITPRATPSMMPAIDELRLLVPVDAIEAGATDSEVIDSFKRVLEQLAAAGATITRLDMPMLTEASIAAREGWVIAVEAFDWHRQLIAERLDMYDPRVGSRILLGAEVLAADYVAALRKIGECRLRYDKAVIDVDAVITPTVPILPPRIADLQSNDAYLSMNTEVLRLTEIANRLDLPSVTMPCKASERRPIGVMLTGRRAQDDQLLDISVAVEACLSAGNG